METIRNSNPSMAFCAAIFTIVSVASSAWAADVAGEQSFADRATQSGVIFVEGTLGPIDENAGQAPGLNSSAPAQSGKTTNELYNKMPDEVVGLNVVDVEGEIVGTVDNLVVDTAKSQISAVVAVDKILGLVGGKKIVIPLDAFQLRGDNLKVAFNKDQLKTSPEYIEENYVPIPEKDQRPIIDFLAFDTDLGKSDVNLI
ncbi:MAG: PRC-barrel domain-containing protein [Methylococcaceae bacterium]|nr:PRC-barrel domain-containing protein [Methylococcaceae bacterium]